MVHRVCPWVRVDAWWRCCVVAVVLTRVIPAWAHPDVDAAREAFLNGDFNETLKRLHDAERSPAATEEDRVAIHWYRAAIFHAQGNTVGASDCLDKLLVLRPLYQPDRAETPPHLRALFHARAAAYQDAYGVTLDPPRLEGTRVLIEMHGHPQQVHQLRVFARARGGVDYAQFALVVQGHQAQGVLDQRGLWQQVAREGVLELVVEAENARGVPVSRLGDALHPLVLEVDEQAAWTAVALLTPQPVQTLPELPVEPQKPEVKRVPEPVPARANPVSMMQRIFGGPLPAPWVAMGVPTVGSFGCCFMSMMSFILLSCALPLFALSQDVTGQDPGPVLAPTAVTSWLCCSVAHVACLQGSLFGICTGTLMAAEFYYRKLLPAGSSLVPEEDAEEVNPQPLVNTMLAPRPAQGY